MSNEKEIERRFFIARQFHCLLEELDCNLEMLSFLTGISEEYLSKIENAEITPSRINLISISRALGIDVSQFDLPESI